MLNLFSVKVTILSLLITVTKGEGMKAFNVGSVMNHKSRNVITLLYNHSNFVENVQWINPVKLSNWLHTVALLIFLEYCFNYFSHLIFLPAHPHTTLHHCISTLHVSFYFSDFWSQNNTITV